jgi:hypothetical protein
MTMNRLLVAGAFMVLSAAASARETGIINQAGPYEATMRFYLHPALGFPGKAEATEQNATVANADAKDKLRAQNSREAAQPLQAVEQASNPQRDRTDHVATRELR